MSENIKEVLMDLSKKETKALVVLNMPFLNALIDGVKVICRAESAMSTSSINIGGIIKTVFYSHATIVDKKLSDHIPADCARELKIANKGVEFGSYYGSYSNNIAPLNVMIKHGCVSIDPINISDIVDEFDQRSDTSKIPDSLHVHEEAYKTENRDSGFVIISKIPDSKIIRNIMPKSDISSSDDLIKLLSDANVISFLESRSVIFVDKGRDFRVMKDVDNPNSKLSKKLKSLGLSIQYEGGRYSSTLKIVNKKATIATLKRKKIARDNIGIFVKNKYYTPYINNGFCLAMEIIRNRMNNLGINMGYVRRIEYDQQALNYWDVWFLMGDKIKKSVSKKDMKSVNKFLLRMREDMKKLKSLGGLLVIPKSHIGRVVTSDPTGHGMMNAKENTRKAFRLFLNEKVK